MLRCYVNSFLTMLTFTNHVSAGRRSMKEFMGHLMFYYTTLPSVLGLIAFFRLYMTPGIFIDENFDHTLILTFVVIGLLFNSFPFFSPLSLNHCKASFEYIDKNYKLETKREGEKNHQRNTLLKAVTNF